MNEEEAVIKLVGMGAIFGRIYAAFLITLFTIIILKTIACWKIYKKSGEKGWKSLILFYSLYIRFKIFWKPIEFLKYIGLFVLQILTLYLTNILHGILAVITAILALAVLVYLVIYKIKISYKMSKSFGYGKKFTVGLVLLNTIFLLILGFGKKSYEEIK